MMEIVVKVLLRTSKTRKAKRKAPPTYTMIYT